MFSNIKRFFGVAVGICFGVLLLLLRLKSNKVDALEDELGVEKANSSKLEAALDTVQKESELRAEADGIHEANSVSGADDVAGRLRKYQRD